jgi:hypothetical protein
MTTDEARAYVRNLPADFRNRIEFYRRFDPVWHEVRDDPRCVFHILQEAIRWPSYQALIGLGPPCVAYMLREARKDMKRAVLLTPALCAITGSAPPSWFDLSAAMHEPQMAKPTYGMLAVECLHFWRKADPSLFVPSWVIPQ